MRILDEQNCVLETVDETKGYLIKDRVFVAHHEAAEAVREQGHWEVVAEYPNGGKDVDWVVDVPGVKAMEAWDEYEDILRFVQFSEKELAERRIWKLKQNLLDTDQHILKIVEGTATLTEMAEVVAQRAKWRKEIDQLDQKIKMQ